MDNLNWRNYKILIQRDFTEDQIGIVQIDTLMKKNEITQKAIDLVWSDFVKGKKSVGLEFWDSEVFRLNQFKEKEGTLECEISTTTFKDLTGTNASNWILGDIYGEEYLANGIIVQSIVITAEGSIVLGKRNTKVQAGLETLAIFGGTIEKEESKPNKNCITDGIKLELLEELGIQQKDIRSFKLKSIFKDWKSYPIFLFETQLNVNNQDLNDSYSKAEFKDEHVGLEFFNDKDLKDNLSLNPFRFNDLTLASFNIYFN